MSTWWCAAASSSNAAERLVPRHRPLVRLEQEQRLDAERDRGEDPERAEADPGDVEDVGVLVAVARSTSPVPVTSSRPATCADSAGGDAAGAVGAGRDRAGERLLGDVAHVVQGQAEPLELGVERLSGVPAAAVTVIASRSTATIPVSRSGRSMRVLGRGDRGEAVAGADHLHGASPALAAPGVPPRRPRPTSRGRHHPRRAGPTRGRTSSSTRVMGRKP